MDKNATPVVSDLVLLGGGHANIQVLKMTVSYTHLTLPTIYSV